MVHNELRLSGGKLSGIKVSDGDTFFLCDFISYEQNENIFVGVTGLTFDTCRLVNCIAPQDAVLVDCTVVDKPFCTNKHPYLSGKKNDCAIECSHLQSTEALNIDGVCVDTIYHYEDIVHVS